MFRITNEGKRLALDSIRRELAGVAVIRRMGKILALTEN